MKTADEPRVHDVAAPEERTAQVAGKDEVTQTPNPKALFRMNKGGADEPDNAGNPRAPEGEDKASGSGPGLNPDGLDQLDKGLQGRGLVGSLPKPAYPGNKSGKIVIRVTVDASGKVTGAAFEPKGFDRKRRRAGRGRRRRGRARPASRRAVRRCRAVRSPIFSAWSESPFPDTVPGRTPDGAGCGGCRAMNR